VTQISHSSSTGGSLVAALRTQVANLSKFCWSLPSSFLSLRMTNIWRSLFQFSGRRYSVRCLVPGPPSTSLPLAFNSSARVLPTNPLPPPNARSRLNAGAGLQSRRGSSHLTRSTSTFTRRTRISTNESPVKVEKFRKDHAGASRPRRPQVSRRSTDYSERDVIDEVQAGAPPPPFSLASQMPSRRDGVALQTGFANRPDAR